MADSKITALTADTAPASTDVTVTIDDTAGTPVTKKVTWANVATALSGMSPFGTAATKAFIDDDTFATASATNVPSAESVKAYVDASSVAGAVLEADTSTAGWSFVVDEDDMVSDSATKLPTQQSVKAYVDNLPTLTTSDVVAVPISTTGGVTTIDVSNLLTTASAWSDADFRLEATADATKDVVFDLSGSTAATTTTIATASSVNRTVTLPDLTGVVALTSGVQTFTDKTLTSPVVNSPTVTTGVLGVSATLTAQANAHLTASASITVDYATGMAPASLTWSGLNIFDQAGVSASTAAANRFAWAAGTIRNDAASAVSPGNSRIFDDGTAITAHTQAGLSAGNYFSYRCSTNYSVMSTGTFTSGTYTGFSANPTIGAGVTLSQSTGYSGFATVAGTVTTLTGVKVNDPVVTGTVTTSLGVDIQVFDAATTNIAYRNAGNTVLTPTARTLTAAGNSLSDTASEVRYSTIRLDNTSGGALTLTSAPTLPDGQDGQVVVIFNGSANNVVIQDQGTLASSNLRLGAATRTLGTRDSIMLMYSSTVGDWIELNFTDVV